MLMPYVNVNAFSFNQMFALMRIIEVIFDVHRSQFSFYFLCVLSSSPRLFVSLPCPTPTHRFECKPIYQQQAISSLFSSFHTIEYAITKLCTFYIQCSIKFTEQNDECVSSSYVHCMVFGCTLKFRTACFVLFSVLLQCNVYLTYIIQKYI